MADRPDVSFKVLGFSLALSLLLSLLPGEWEVAGAVTCGTGGGTGTGIGTRELCVNSASDAVDAKPGDGVCATAAGTCTLRAAIMEANALPGAQTIVLLAGTYTLTIPPDATPDDGADGDLDITANLAIIGAGAESTIVQACTTNQKTARCPTGQGIADRVFQVLSGATVDIAGVTIRNGKGLSEGGGILNGGVLSITKSIVSSNTAGTGELSGNGGGILNNGTLAIQDSIVSSNLSGVYGGGIYNLSGSFTMTGSTLRDNIGGYGGAIRSESSTTTISSSTISDNTASFASGGGILSVYGTLTVTGSTISDNNALMAAGGGGILTSSTTIIINSTISGNRASDFGGGGIHSLSPVTVISSTVVGNSATDSKGGGGLRNFYAHNPFVLRNSIVANSPKGGNCAGVITSEGYNLSSDATCGLAGTGDLQNTDPKLGPLADNGGPTQTHALMTGGPAIDAVPVATCTDPSGNPLVADQRGGPRPIDGDGDGVAACDIGAFELMVAPILLSPADGARLTTIGTLLSWQNPPGTTQAHIQVISSDTGAAVIDQTLRFPATSFIVPEPGVILSNLSYNYILLPDTAYTWRVQTLNLSNQSWGPWA
ncbi:MAG: right-handed parallel beta-helix repeat-containing protein, partial [Chloroflexi bacterium]|nr:right-handed parallel beta-helix repeat-containing protein [Chloroflexota bacterium]